MEGARQRGMMALGAGVMTVLLLLLLVVAAEALLAGARGVVNVHEGNQAQALAQAGMEHLAAALRRDRTFMEQSAAFLQSGQPVIVSSPDAFADGGYKVYVSGGSTLYYSLSVGEFRGAKRQLIMNFTVDPADGQVVIAGWNNE